MSDPNLGMLSIATVATAAGYAVIYYDTQLPGFSREQLALDLAAIRPAVVGMSTNSDNIYTICRLTPLIQQICPGVRIVLGGPHATALAHDTLLRTGADVVVRGEGELTMRELLHFWLRSEGRLDDIDGIVYRDRGEVFSTREREFIGDLDTLPLPDRGLLPDHKQYSGILISGRGCPYHCAFCFEGTAGNRYRKRSAASTFREIQLLVDTYGYRYISFADDTFVADPDRVSEVCRLIRTTYGDSPPFAWYCEGRIDILHKHPGLIDEMVKAGLVRLQLGVETGNQDVLDLYEKRITLSQIQEVVSACARSGVVSLFVNFIIGGPFENRDRINASRDFAIRLCELAPGRVECFSTYLTPFPGTKITLDPLRYGLKPLDPEMELSESMSYPFFESADMDKWDLVNARLDFDFAVGRKMDELVASIPKSLIDQHIRAYRQGMRSLWMPYFMNRRAIKRYYSMLEQASFDAFGDLTTEEVLVRYPLRLIAPLAARGRRLVLLAGRRPLRLNEEGTLLYELSSGRKTAQEVIDTAYQRIRPMVTKQVFTAQTLEFFAAMEEEFAIVFRDV